MPRPERTHLLRRNEAVRSPRRVLVLDCEASAVDLERQELQLLRLWVARLTLREKAHARRREQEWWQGEDVDSLLDCIEAATPSTEALWIFCHNLSYDLGLTHLPLGLLERGWTMGSNNLASDSPWALFRKGSKVVRLADSASWLPVPVKLLGQQYGIEKPKLPEWDGPQEKWWERCRMDVVATSTALLALMDEWDRRELGSWSVTGSACAWNSMLHFPSPHKVVVDPDHEARRFEREALYGGRREVWSWGQQPRGRYLELDIRHTHLSVCAHLPLPWRRNPQPFSSLPLDHPAWDTRIGLLADCRLRVREPAFPLRVGRQVLYPVGEFRTRLCGPELRDARRRGELLEVGAGYAYGMGGRLPGWAQWVEEELEAPDGAIEPALRIFLKAASRAVPGRWAMQVARLRDSGPSRFGGWKLEPISVGKGHAPGYLFHFGGQWQELVHDQDADDSFPAVLAFIESHVRVALRRALEWLGEGCVLQCATDSVLAPLEAYLGALARTGGPAGSDQAEGASTLDILAALDELTAPLRWRVKGEPRSLELQSPQHVRRDGVPGYSAVPRTAEEIEPGVFRWWTWPRLRGQMERGDPRGYVRELRTVRLQEVGLSKWAYEDGCVRAPESHGEAAGGGEAYLEPPPAVCGHGAPLRALQGRVLSQVLKGSPAGAGQATLAHFAS